MGDEPAERSRADTEIGALLEYTGITPPARVLDAGCGHGRHALALAARGFEVVGIDVAGEALRRAEALAGERALRVQFIEQDMRELAFAGEFDLVISLWTSFGYADSDDELAGVVGRFARALRPGGHAVIESINRDGQLPVLPGTTWELGDGGELILDANHFEPLTGTLVVRRTRMAPGQRPQHESWRVRLFACEELARIFTGAGLTDVVVAAGFAGHDEPPVARLHDYTPRSLRILMCGRKPELGRG